MILKSQPTAQELDAGRHMVFWQAGWPAFEKILEALPGRRLRTAYSAGDLEIMSPLPLHEALKAFFGYLLLVLAEECALPMRCLGSTTYRRSDVERGIEADQSYYFTAGKRVRDWADLDLNVDPPPDLAVEIEITSSVLNRIENYEKLRVPELWRCDEESLQVLRLDAAERYQPSTASGLFPSLPVDKVLAVWQSARASESDIMIVAAIRKWVRDRVVGRSGRQP